MFQIIFSEITEIKKFQPTGSIPLEGPFLTILRLFQQKRNKYPIKPKLNSKTPHPTGTHFIVRGAKIYIMFIYNLNLWKDKIL